MKKTDALFAPVRTAGGPDNWFFDFGKHYFAVLEIETEVETAREITLAVGEKELDKRTFAKLEADCDLMLARTLKEEYDRISAFCKSFDYNSEIVPDGKAIEKMIEVL